MGSIGKLLAAILAALTSGSGGAGGPATIANGADVAEGSTTDAAVSTDANGTVSAKLRGLIVLWVNYLTRVPAALDSTGAYKASNPPFSIPLEGSHDQDTTIDTATTITPTGDYIVMQATVSGKNVRYTLDGTTPTASLGFVMVAQDPPVRFPTAGKTFKVIAETAGAALDWQDEQTP